ncbi:hypothetical protein [Amycolatopsis magusensis]|uniref:hypothetical protein n=1 Tax=Amycolatopsis magusensis TaxID=882444 RepID=UPI003C2DD2AD
MLTGSAKAFAAGADIKEMRLQSFGDIDAANWLLEQVDRDLTTDPTIWVRSRLLTMTKDPDLQSLRVWAKAWVKGLPPASSKRRHIPFGPAPLREAAELCGLSIDELADRLRRLE